MALSCGRKIVTPAPLGVMQYHGSSRSHSSALGMSPKSLSENETCRSGASRDPEPRLNRFFPRVLPEAFSDTLQDHVFRPFGA